MPRELVPADYLFVLPVVLAVDDFSGYLPPDGHQSPGYGLLAVPSEPEEGAFGILAFEKDRMPAGLVAYPDGSRISEFYVPALVVAVVVDPARERTSVLSRIQDIESLSCVRAPDGPSGLVAAYAETLGGAFLVDFLQSEVGFILC